MSFNLDSAKLDFVDAAEHVGLTGFAFEVVIDGAYGPQRRVHFLMRKTVEIPLSVDIGNRKVFFDECILPLVKPVEQSPAVASQLKESRERLESAQKQCAELKIIIEGLEKFKQKFDLDYQLAHGKPFKDA